MNEFQVNQYAKQIFEQNKAAGWWDDMDRDMEETLMLCITESAEAVEGIRKGLMDDKLPHRKMEEVELADMLIRVLDYAGRYEWLYCDRGVDANVVSAKKLAGKHLWLCYLTCALAKDIKNRVTPIYIRLSYSLLVSSILYVADDQGYDLVGAIDEKLAYNKQRADHKRENRAAEGGKKF